MNKIAIKGHSTRGKDVIKILKSLGGNNKSGHEGRNISIGYYIAENNLIICDSPINIPKDYKLYTLEEYEQKLNIMENKRTIQIDLTTAKQWYKQGGDLQKVALQAFSEQELQKLPKSWEDYCKIHPVVYKEYYLHSTQVQICSNPSASRLGNPDTFKTKEKAEQFITLNKLLQIRDYYNQGWTPDWEDGTDKYVIWGLGNKLRIDTSTYANALFVFKTKELRDEFLTNFESQLKSIKEFL